MKRKVDEKKRTFLKGLFLTGLGVSVLSKGASARKRSAIEEDEVLYRETEAFRAYYESLRN